MEKGTCSILSIFLIAVMLALILPRVVLGNPRAEVVNKTCSDQQQQNSNTYVSNFVDASENVRKQIQTRDYGLEISGQGPDAVYLLFQCYGDLSLTDCELCYSAARTNMPQCYPKNGATIFFDGCFARAENFSFFQEFSGPHDKAICGNITRTDSEFQETAREAVLQAAEYAPNNNGYARVEMLVSGTAKESAYVLADCWKTLNANSCRACLENASTSILRCFPWSEGRALNAGCFMRYSNTNFLNPTPSIGSSKRTKTVVIAAVCSAIGVAGVAIIGAFIWKPWRRERKRKDLYDAKELAKNLTDKSLNFKFSTLEKATDGFDEANKLGEGGYGIVYKGVLPDGREIAVKRLFSNNIHRAEEIFNELNIVSCLEHKNLVRLLGCSLFGPESLLVYEFIANQSLDNFIFNSDENKALNWERRFVIIIGMAEGLVYLHENSKMRIIHRDIKASNILLNAKFRAKIVDFGLARAFQEDKSHISTRVVGTLGYMAPEYLVHGQLTEKADVYSFGVLLLEIVTGRRNNVSGTPEYPDSLISIVWNHFQQGTTSELIDPNLMLPNYHNICVKDEVLRVIHVGLLCIQEIPVLRPSMSKALQMLAKKVENLPPPTKPPFTDE